MTKKELIMAVSENTGYRQTAVNNVINALLSEISKALLDNKRVYLSGFGSFETKTRPSRNLRDFSGNNITTAEHKSVIFREGKVLKSYLNTE